jgi:hypothetical protein
MERIEKLSDHAPLLLDTNSDKLHGKKLSFKFELGWLSRDGFEDMVKEVWNRPVKGSSAILRWNNKISALRKHLRGWTRHYLDYTKKKRKGSQE